MWESWEPQYQLPRKTIQCCHLITDHCCILILARWVRKTQAFSAPLVVITYVSIVWRQPEAKKRKLWITRGISTAFASQTGFPWSRDSASANSSSRLSTMSAILFMNSALSRAAVLDHLQMYRECFFNKVQLIISCTHTHTHTHFLNALLAASTASWTSSSPLSGTLRWTSPVAGL